MKNEKSQTSKDLDNILFNYQISYCQNKDDKNYEKMYIEKWIESQIDQKHLRSKNLSNDTKKVISSFIATRKVEKIAFHKIKNHYVQKIKELKNDLKLMNNEYEKKIEEIELRYQIAIEDRKQCKQNITIEFNLFAQHIKEMKEYSLNTRRKPCQ